MDLLLDESALRKLSTLRPRDCDYIALDITSSRALFTYLAHVSPVACLLGASVSGPELRLALVARLGGDPEVGACCNILAGGWLPEGAVPEVGEPVTGWLSEIALGAPGDPVAYGKTPPRVTKLARLLLARAGAYPRRRLLDAARHAYDGPYNAHDAVAALFVTAPDVALRVAGELVASRAKSTSIRRHTADVVRWAIRAGYASESVMSGMPMLPTLPPPRSKSDPMPACVPENGQGTTRDEKSGVGSEPSQRSPGLPRHKRVRGPRDPT